MLFDLLDKVQVIETKRTGVIYRIDTVNTTEYYFTNGETLERTEFRYYVNGDFKSRMANELITVEKKFIDKQ